ncbi:MAG TPA: alanine racemase [Candidatus Kryptonia bacterium]
MTRAEVDLSAISYNIKQVAHRVGANTRILGVMKANAYGHGLAAASQAVLESGASYLGVAFDEEGIDLRKHTQVPILVFSPPIEDSFESYIRFDLDSTLTSVVTAYSLNAVARASGRKARVQIKVDTGMGRLGFFPKEALDAVRVISSLDSLTLVGVYSHFATSDEANKEFALRQLTAFRGVVAGVKDMGLDSLIFHMANSGAILDMHDTSFDMVRPGIMSYGYYPSIETSESVDIKPALSLKSAVAQVKNFPAGASVSYGRRYFTKKNCRIAVIPVGYGDGFTRLLTGKANVIIKGKKFPVVGTITMDHVMVDVGAEYDIQPGDEVTLIGRDGEESITAWDLAASIGTIPYEILCMINGRVPRVYNGIEPSHGERENP